MMSSSNKPVRLALLASALLVAACSQEGPAERAGKALDESASKAGAALREGPAERTGKKIDTLTDKAGEQMKALGDEISEGARR